MSIDPVLDHMHNWWAVVAWVVLFGAFLLFTPFYKRSGVKPNGAFMAFVVALAFEMFGIPLSMYALSGALGRYMPDGILWGHTLVGYVGLAGTQVAIVMYVVALALVVAGWRAIYRDYWSKDRGSGTLVTSGIYRYVRHPQYTGFALATLGMLFEWATLPTLIMWPILMVIYYRLARREEADMREEFGEAYDEYAASTGMFLPTKAMGGRQWGGVGWGVRNAPPHRNPPETTLHSCSPAPHNCRCKSRDAEKNRRSEQ